ncbi:hypothetical protein GCM10010442_75750 [Kitasatospora kifunensis]
MLRCAGLDAVTHQRVNDARLAPVAWHSVIAGSTVSTVAVRDDQLDLAAELNRQWHRLAVEHGVIDSHGAFVLHPEDTIGLFPHPDHRCSTGCCGPDGVSGRNRVCTCGVEVATLVADCWTYQELWLDPSASGPSHRDRLQ